MQFQALVKPFMFDVLNIDADKIRTTPSFTGENQILHEIVQKFALWLEGKYPTSIAPKPVATNFLDEEHIMGIWSKTGGFYAYDHELTYVLSILVKNGIKYHLDLNRGVSGWGIGGGVRYEEPDDQLPTV
jgi:hypothetical protein